MNKTVNSRLALGGIAVACLGVVTARAQLAPAPLAPDAAAPTTTPAVVATVNGESITGAELDKQMDRMARELSQQVPAEQLMQYRPRLREQAINDLVDKHLLKQAVVREKVVVPDAAIKQQEDEIFKTVPEGHNIDDDLKAEGLTRQSFEDQLRESMTVRALLDRQSPTTTPSDAVVQAYYDKNPAQFQQGETVSARHILVAFAAGDDDAKKALKRKKADDIRTRLLKGEDFAKVCSETSDDPGSAANGGLYENFPRGQMVPPFDNAAFSQKVGEVGPIVETQFGYHIIKVEKHNAPTTVPFDTVKAQLKDYLAQTIHNDAVQAYVKGLHDAAQVTYSAGFAPSTQPAAPALGQ